MNNTISGNLAISGAAIACYRSAPRIVNTTLSGNSATAFGGAIFCYTSWPTIQNTTLHGNSATLDGGGISCTGLSLPTITNSILWNDTPNEIHLDTLSDISVNYSNVQGGHVGTDNISADPLFLDPAAGDFRQTR